MIAPDIDMSSVAMMQADYDEFQKLIAVADQGEDAKAS